MSDLRVSAFMIASESPFTLVDCKDLSMEFGEIIEEAVGKLSQVQEDTGKTIKGDITQAILAVKMTDIPFQLMAKVKNKLVYLL